MLTAVPATRTNRIRAQSSRSAAQMVKQANVDHNDNNNHDDDDDNTDFDDDADEHHDELLRLAQLHDDNDALDDAPPVVLSAPPLAAPSAAPPAAPHRTSAAKSFLNALTGRKKSKLPAAPKRSDRPGPRTSFTFAADEVDEDVALFGPDAASQHKSKKWFAWLSRLNPTAASPAPKASPRAVPARAAPAVAEADADAAAGTRLVAKSLDVRRATRQIMVVFNGFLFLFFFFFCLHRNCLMKSART
jgi:hypothetical protein